MSYYFPDLIAAIDVAAEQKRLQSVTFASDTPMPAPKPEKIRQLRLPTSTVCWRRVIARLR